MSTPKVLLERYVDAKDLAKPHLIPEVYSRDALLTFSIETDAISFPLEVTGAASIAKVLVTDFSSKYGQCKTYYVCDALEVRNDRISGLPWLVLMKDSALPKLRVGCGYYHWNFEQDVAGAQHVSAMHIHIQRMDVVEDPDGVLLGAVQAVLPYPWLSPSVLQAQIDALIDANPAFGFLDAYKNLRELAQGFPVGGDD
jgi:hypothetical protein